MTKNVPTTLVASGARTASDVSSAAPLRAGMKALMFLLDMTAPLKDAGDKIDILIQDSPDGGTTYNDLVAYVQVLGNASASKQLAIVNCEVAPTTALGEPTDGTMSDGVRAGPCGNLVRAKWIVTKDGDSPEDQSFTFSITMLPIH